MYFDKCEQRSARLALDLVYRISLPRNRSTQRRMLTRSLFSLNEMKKEIEESMAVTTHEFAIAFSYYLFAALFPEMYCS